MVYEPILSVLSTWPRGMGVPVTVSRIRRMPSVGASR